MTLQIIENIHPPDEGVVLPSIYLYFPISLKLGIQVLTGPQATLKILENVHPPGEGVDSSPISLC